MNSSRTEITAPCKFQASTQEPNPPSPTPASSSASNMPVSASSSTWQPAAACTIKDKIDLFETNSKKTPSLSRLRSSDNINFDCESLIHRNSDKDLGLSQPHHHHHHLLRTCSLQSIEEGTMFRGSTMKQDLNQLRLKADELERIFAEHKRRVNIDTDHAASTVNSCERGRMYEKYMEKRNARRREEWGRNRGEKAAEMGEMWESLELMAKNYQITISMLAEDDEDIQSTDSSSNIIKSKMLKSRTTSSSTSRTSSSSVLKPSSKPLTSHSLRGEYRKENTKPQVQPNKIPRCKSTSSGTNSSSSLRKSSVAPLTPIKTTKEKIGLNPRIDQQLDSPTESTSSTRARKKWGSVEKPVLVPDGSGTKGFKRFLHFGKKSREAYQVSGADYDTEVGCGLASEQIGHLNMDCALDAYDGFSYSEGMSMPEQVQTPRRPIPTFAPSKLRKDHVSETSPRSPRSFFSLSTFRNKGVESRLR